MPTAIPTGATFTAVQSDLAAVNGSTVFPAANITVKASPIVGQQLQVAVTLDPKSVPSGTYSGTIQVVSSGGGAAPSICQLP